MFRGFRLTLYDIFGYLAPGMVFLAGMAILFWAIYIPRIPFSVFRPTADGWVFFLLLAYFSGHIVQALGNLLANLLPCLETSVISREGTCIVPEFLVESAKREVGAMLGFDVKDMASEWLLTICDETVAQRGVRDRDIYQSREGFYRGLAVSFLALFLSLVARTSVPGTSVRLSGSLQVVSGSTLLFFILFSLAGTLLAFFRYRRFARYRITQAIVGFLVLRARNSS